MILPFYLGIFSHCLENGFREPDADIFSRNESFKRGTGKLIISVLTIFGCNLLWYRTFFDWICVRKDYSVFKCSSRLVPNWAFELHFSFQKLREKLSWLLKSALKCSQSFSKANREPNSLLKSHKRAHFSFKNLRWESNTYV